VSDRYRYGLAVLGYIGLAMLTKQFLTWTYGPLYFVLTLEVLPRTWRRLRGRRVTELPAAEGAPA
jgi:4-amino-4-deoxy-L-arabinose transferase-like glycosyltransferase